MNYKIKLSGKMYSELMAHLYPGDNKEAISIALCGRNSIGRIDTLLVHRLIHIPYNQCAVRTEYSLKWSTESLEEYLPDVVKHNWGIIKIHSHPNGYPQFSELDDKSDKEFFKSIYGWTNTLSPHASMIMFPDFSLKARIITPESNFIDEVGISVIGDDILFHQSNQSKEIGAFSMRTKQAFGEGTVNILKNLKVAVVGCSGTGSPVIEQLVRLGVGHLILVDPDIIEQKNLNRIINSTTEHAKNGVKKVIAAKEYIDKIGIGTEVTVFPKNIFESLEIVQELSTCDIIFGCVDSVDGRHVLNQIATFYLVAFFDIGVKLIADGIGGVSQICGTVHYIQPGGSSLLTRGLYNYEELRAAGLYRTDIKEFEEQKKSGYIANITVESPAVISVNMFAASIAVNEFLARIHRFRFDKNQDFAITQFSNTDSYIMYDNDGSPDEYLKKFVGRGQIKPLLNMPEFSNYV
jgi:ThiF family/Prokaryotic homologs of the JAB domain